MLWGSGRGDFIGLDIGSSAVKLAQISKSSKGYRLEKLGIQELGPGMIVDGAVVDPDGVVLAIREILKTQSVKAKKAVLSVSGHSVIIKTIKLPEMTDQELTESMKWEAEQYIPFDLQDVSLNHYVLGRSSEDAGQMDVVLVAAKKDKLQSYTDLALRAGLKPVVVDVDVFALANLCQMNNPWQEEEAIALVNMGASVINLYMAKGTGVMSTRDISIGGNRYTETLQRELNVDPRTAESLKRKEGIEGVDPEAVLSLIRSLNMEIANEIVASFDYFKMTSSVKKIDRVLLSGGLTKLSDLPAQISEKCEVPVEILDPFKNVQIPQKWFDRALLTEAAPLMAVSIGLALRDDVR